MAISKILYMKDCGGHFHGKHLKAALEYVMNKEKTQDGKLVMGVNCQAESAFEEMKSTKEKFGKLDKRQGYHLIISFVEGEVEAETAFEITRKFVKEYLGTEYEAVFAVHDNTDHIHSHILFNSVSFMTGKKYRYEKGDWAKYIQPITNRLCKEYGLSTIEFEEDDKNPKKYHGGWSEYHDGKSVFGNMIRRDIDACILQAFTFESFVNLLVEKGYEVKNSVDGSGKYLALKAPGMSRFKRCKSFGENYSEERIRDRILTETIAKCYRNDRASEPKIFYCKVKRWKRAKLSGLQKRYFKKLYRIGKLKKKPYSQAWRYRNYIRKMHKLQEQYLFLVRHHITNTEDLIKTTEILTDQKKQASSEKSKAYKKRRKYESLFRIGEEMHSLLECEKSYVMGDNFFEEEHSKWISLQDRLQKEGYTLEEIEVLKKHCKNEIAFARDKEKKGFQEVTIAKSLLQEISVENSERNEMEEMKQEIVNYERRKEKQPIR